jgi:16S rRNA (uracil1498-N3)-methyltransferase
MVERGNQAEMITFFADGIPERTSRVMLGGDAAQHAKARRLKEAHAVRLVDGKGHVATGRIASIGRSEIQVDVETLTTVPAPRPLELIVPVADKERMLWVAEKSTELQVTLWIPVMFARSRSVSPRGEGVKFAEKVAARMRSALEQSGGAWMPTIVGEHDAQDAFRDVGRTGAKALLDIAGGPLSTLATSSAFALAVGPEGGLESEERDAAIESGWRPATIGPTTLRFETAAIAGIAIVRAAQLVKGAG